MVPLEPILFRFPGVPGVECAFSTRAGGTSRPPYAGLNLSFDVGDAPESVAANRLALAGRLGVTQWCELHQIHGEKLFFEPEPTPLDAASKREGDAQATSRRGLALVIKTADCQPVLLAHEKGRFVAGLHVGWRGNVLNLPGSGVARLCAHYACTPAELFAVRGPSLGPDHAQFVNFDREFGPKFAAFHDPATHLVDLWRLTRAQLLAAGLRPERIFGIDRCTYSEPKAFFSYRRDRACGRMMALIRIE